VRLAGVGRAKHGTDLRREHIPADSKYVARHVPDDLAFAPGMQDNRPLPFVSRRFVNRPFVSRR
jgi:hypothetical protein